MIILQILLWVVALLLVMIGILLLDDIFNFGDWKDYLVGIICLGFGLFLMFTFFTYNSTNKGVERTNTVMTEKIKIKEFTKTDEALLENNRLVSIEPQTVKQFQTTLSQFESGIDYYYVKIERRQKGLLGRLSYKKTWYEVVTKDDFF